MITTGLQFVKDNPKLLTIGIRPSSPNTGYGYIQYNEDRQYEGTSIYDVKIFTEKPELEVARQFVESGEFLWNAGIFMWSLPEIEKAFMAHLPEVYELFKRGEGIYNTPAEDEFIKSIYLSSEEKNIYLLMSEKFMNRLGLMNWYIITLFAKNEGVTEMFVAIRNLLSAYMEKSKVAEYISVMVMELALNNENTNIRKEAKTMYHGIDDIDSLIFDPEVRAKIVQELQRKHELVFISWKLGGGSSSIGKQGRLSITLYNKDDEFQEVKENIESAKSSNTNKKTLIDFYRELPDGQEGTDLGVYYLSYLDDACKKVNVKFESLVNQFSASELTVINLNFNF